MRAEVSAVAFRLFAEQGFEKTTVDQIAAEAGLSRTTFFRYFGTKEEVVLGKREEVGQAVAAALSARPEGERLWVSLRRAFDVLTSIEADNPERCLSLMRLLSDSYALTTRQREKTQGWPSMLVPEAARRLGGGPEPTGTLRAQALVASAIACLDAAVDAWMATDGKHRLSALADEAMGTVSELTG